MQPVLYWRGSLEELSKNSLRLVAAAVQELTVANSILNVMKFKGAEDYSPNKSLKLVI